MRINTRGKMLASVVITALLISSMVLIPTQASAFNVALTMPSSSYLLGQTPSFTGSLNLEGNTEVINIQQVQLVMDGPSLDFTVNLPVNEGAFSYNLPQSGSDPNRGTVSGSISWNNINFTSGYGYGYSNPAGSVAKINYTINWQPPVMLNPAPAQLSALPSWQTAFNTNGNAMVKGVGYRGGDYQDLYVLVAGSPNDKIQIYDLGSGNAPTVVDLSLGSSLEALDLFPNKGIYVADTSWYSDAPNGRIYRLNITSPTTVLNTWAAPFQIGGLANDGTNLLAASKYGNQLQKINPNTGANVGSPFFLMAPGGPPLYGMSIPGSNGLGFYSDNNNLIWANNNQIFRIDMSGASPSVQGVENLNPYISVDGLTVTGNGTIFMGTNEMGVNKIVKARHPNSPPTEMSSSGSYNAKLKVISSSTTYESSAAAFSLNKVSSVSLTLTSPSTTTFATSTPTVTIAGSTNDPSVTQVSVATALGTTEFINDKVETTTAPAGKNTGQVWQPSGMWHQSENRSLDTSGASAVGTVNQTGKKSWAYNQPAGFPGAMPPVNYDNGAANSGFLESKDTFSIKGDSALTFWTAWNTEPTDMFDRKYIQAFVDGQWRTVAQIVEFVPGMTGGFFAPPPMGPPTGGLQPYGVSSNMATVVDPPGGMGAPPNSPPGWPWKLVMVPQFTWQKVQLDFTGSNSFNNKDIKIRFYFDTYDMYANFMEGWYVDNVVFKGAAAAGVSIPVTNMNFSTSVALGDGTNTIIVSADSGYKAAFTPVDNGAASKTLTGSLDNTGPVISLGNMTPSGGSAVALSTNPVTGTASVALTWAVAETNIDAVTLSQASNAGTKPITPALVSAGNYKAENVVLVAGTNTFTFGATDQAGNIAAAKTASVTYDITGPTITAVSTVYPTGQVSARAGDFLVFQSDAEDTGSGVKQVDLLLSTQSNLTDSWTSTQVTALNAGTEVTISGTPSRRYQKIDGTVYQLVAFTKASNIPQAVLTQWGVGGTLTNRWVAPFNLPSAAPLGTYSLTARAKDQGDNSSTGTLTASVVSTLSSFNILLMPSWNLISTPLIPTNTSIATVFSGMQAQGLLSVWYYNSVTGAWQSYDPSAPSGANSLTTFEAGKGYWVNMNPTGWPTDPPLAAGFAETPRPVKLTVTGMVLRPGEVPPTYTIKAGWNLIGLHSENNKVVSIALKGLTSPFGASLWASLLEYKNYISYPTQAGQSPETVLGKFDFLDSSSTMNPGKGYWLYAIQDTTLTP